ncbi:amidohydrolase [Allostreptomyces psammosilenae]|uniref:Hippurate hydrolase n=1 Tax=Allostreptomyces psammosilenae TaxID=1892865 RepID=A0A852ZYA2_9ACTN|nr:amidohydrolase [Allostreptomyces psammosilenae]NYI03601.1 hippurate hydrolase [Allostreptomyces psammosilenae]
MTHARARAAAEAAAGPAALAGLPRLLPRLADLYRDLHAHPELSFAETRTAAVVAERLRRTGARVTTGIGGTGVAAVLGDGAGPHVLLRADIDALPVREATGLPYASTADGVAPDGEETPVMHACGHDMHVTCLVGAMELLAEAGGHWSGTVTAVFQPGEEVGGGARAMVDDGLFDTVGRPDVVLGQHVAPFPAGTVAHHTGPTLAASDSLRVRLFGRGAHGSRPEASVDPVVMAAATVMRLQTVVSREIAGTETAVVTVGALRAGDKDNVIPDEAELRLTVRTYTEEVRATVLAAVERIVRGEAAAAGAPREPEITHVSAFPALVNDAAATERVVRAFRDHFGPDAVRDSGPVTGSEDCGVLATAAGAPLCYWFLGGWDPDQYAAAQARGAVAREIPSNHSPRFAPVLHPTLATGVTTLLLASHAWLHPKGAGPSGVRCGRG